MLFVGAGLSRQCLPQLPRKTGLPSWQGLVKAVASRFAADEVSADEVTDATVFFDYVQSLNDCDGEAKLKSSLREALDTRDLARSPAHRIIAGLPWAEVWTTNYEELLEQSFGALAVDGEKDHALIGQYRREQKSFVLHLHGTVANPHTLGAESYRKWAQNDPKIINHIQNTFLSGHSVLFIGYGLGDPNLKAIFDWLRNVTDNKIRMFAFLHKATAFQLKRQATVNNLHAISLDTDSAYVNALTQLRAEWLRQSGTLPSSTQQQKIAIEVTQDLETYERNRAASAMMNRWNDSGVAHLYITDPKYRADDIGVDDVFVEPSVSPWMPVGERDAFAALREGHKSRQEIDATRAKKSARAGVSNAHQQHELEEQQFRRERPVQRLPACAALEQHRLTVLLGDPGSGKSLLLRHQVLKGAKAWRDNAGPLPFYLRLNSWESRSTGDEPDTLLMRCLRDELLSFTGVTREQADAWTASDQAVHWYLDGMDEVRSPVERERVRAGIAAIARMRPQDRIVVSARPNGYTARFDAQWQEIALQPLDDAQVLAVLARWQPIAQKRDAITLPVETLDADMRNSPALQSLRRNPLLLTLAILLYRYLRRLPKDRWEYYEMVDKNLRDNLARMRALKDEKVIASRDAWEPLLGRLALAGMRDGLVRFGRKQLEDVVSDYHCRTLGESPRVAMDESKLFLGAADDLLGVIVAFAPDEYGFLHLTFQEFHAAKRLLAMNVPDEAAERARIMAQAWDNPDWAETWNLFVLGARKERADLIVALMQAALDNGCVGLDQHLPRQRLAVLRWAGLAGALCFGSAPWKSLEPWVRAQMAGGAWMQEVAAALAGWQQPVPVAVRDALLKTLLDSKAGAEVRGHAADALAGAARALRLAQPMPTTA